MRSRPSPPLERLQSLVNWERTARAGMRVGLGPMQDLLQRLGSPHLQWRGVHVTGTKGKGSVASLVESGLRSAGLRAGLYTSPHVDAVAERIRIDGQPLDDATLDACLATVLDARDAAVQAASPAAEATWFDALTAAAFVAFARAGVEFAAVEVGLGGRLDSTNAWRGDVSVVTNVGLEHTEVLGATVEAIAREKAGIVKAGQVLVTPLSQTCSAGAVVHALAAAHGVRVRQVTAAAAGISALNLAIAREVLDALGDLGVVGRTRRAPLGRLDLGPAAIARAALPGRLERASIWAPCVRQRVPVVLDGAHVDFALAAVFDELAREPALRAPPVVLMALGADKNASALLRALLGRAALVVFVPLEHGQPCWAPEQLVALARGLGLPACQAASIRQGLDHCLAHASDGWLLATGSLHLVGALRRQWARVPSPQPSCV